MTILDKMKSQTFKIDVTVNYSGKDIKNYDLSRLEKEITNELQVLLDEKGGYVYDFLRYQLPLSEIFNIILGVNND